MNLTSLSKFLSYVLRHNPASIGLDLDENGWAKVSELIEKAKRNGKTLSREKLAQIMEQGNKQRFIVSDDQQYIRAGYGHSIDVDLQMKPQTPPDKLFHGTARQNVDSIMEEGIKPGNRNFVHLSSTQEEAKNVGSRHGSPEILVVKAKKMSEASFALYQSESESSIWLTKKVPAQFVRKF